MILSVISCIDASYTPFIYFIIIIELQGSALSPLSTLVELNTTLLLFLISLEFDESKSHRKFLQQGCIINCVDITACHERNNRLLCSVSIIFIVIVFIYWKKCTNKRILPSIECKGENSNYDTGRRCQDWVQDGMHC